MFQQNYPGTAIVCRLVSLHVQFRKRSVAMSIAKRSEEGSGGARSRGGSQISADPSDVGSGDTGGGRRQAGGGQVTEEEMTVHRAHREACEVRSKSL